MVLPVSPTVGRLKLPAEDWEGQMGIVTPRAGTTRLASAGVLVPYNHSLPLQEGWVQPPQNDQKTSICRRGLKCCLTRWQGLSSSNHTVRYEKPIFQFLTNTKNTLPLSHFSGALAIQLLALKCSGFWRRIWKQCCQCLQLSALKKVHLWTTVKKIHYCATRYPGFTDTYQLFLSPKTKLRNTLLKW